LDGKNVVLAVGQERGEDEGNMVAAADGFTEGDCVIRKVGDIVGFLEGVLDGAVGVDVGAYRQDDVGVEEVGPHLDVPHLPQP